LRVFASDASALGNDELIREATRRARALLLRPLVVTSATVEPLGGMPARVAARDVTLCEHCGLPTAAPGDAFCCAGCESVWGLLHDEGLERYYALRDTKGAPATVATSRADHKWLDAYDGVCPARLTLDVQGIHCAACVWLFERVFARQPGGVSVLVNPALGKIDLAARPTFALRDFIASMERFGYRIGPALKGAPRPDGALLTRMGVCIAIAMNAMIFAFAIYAGLSDGPIYRMFSRIVLGLGTLSVLVGGSYFFRSAWRALRSGVLHLDLPIALGIALAYSSSLYAHVVGSASTYFDTLTVFIALMLVGRFLQERVVERNRRLILASDGAEGLLTRRVLGTGVATVRCTAITAGDRLLVAPGDLVPVDGALDEARGTVSLDWIDGESAPHDVARGDRVPAGAFNAGASAFTVTASTDFAESPLRALLTATRAGPADAARVTPWWQRFTKIYVAAVLGVGALGFVGWWLLAGDLRRALDVTAGVLIVTCPCAFGIATPLAYELVQAGLRRAGLFVRTAGFLDRAQGIRRVVFDKTGTLTTGVLRVDDPIALRGLPDDAREALYNMAVRSAHPKSAAVAAALEGHARYVPELDVVERAGVGLALARGGAAFALEGRGDAVALFRDGVLVAAIALREDLRPGAASELERLRALGYDTWIASGDAPERVRALAEAVGVQPEKALASCRPDEKARLLEAQPGALMIGDGLNDALAVDRATCSGTPAVDRPFLAARSDFYFTTPGLRPVTLALVAARRLGQVTRRNLAVAVLYNALTVGLAYAGFLSPLVCAVVMPLSSLTIVGMTLASLSPRSALWKS
jgi:Cu2+-exporting ATPase